MSRDKQIAEMARAVCENYGACSKCSLKNIDKDDTCSVYQECEVLYNAGYRKASDVVREIADFIWGEDELTLIPISEKWISKTEFFHRWVNKDRFIAELKTKYDIPNSWVELTHTCQVEIPSTIESIADIAFQESEGEG